VFFGHLQKEELPHQVGYNSAAFEKEAHKQDYMQRVLTVMLFDEVKKQTLDLIKPT
jgi:trans-2-enoyl-CoA reductase